MTKIALVIGLHIIVASGNGASVEEYSTITYRHFESIEACERGAVISRTNLEFHNRMKASKKGLIVRELKISHHCTPDDTGA